RSRLRKLRNVLIRIFDHEMAVERQLRRFAQRLHHRRPDCDIGHEVSVHDIDMDESRTALGGNLHLVREMREISRQNRWRQFDQKRCPQESLSPTLSDGSPGSSPGLNSSRNLSPACCVITSEPDYGCPASGNEGAF